MAKMTATTFLGAARKAVSVPVVMLGVTLSAMPAGAHEPPGLPDSVRPPAFTLPDGHPDLSPKAKPPPARTPGFEGGSPPPRTTGPQARGPKADGPPATPEERAKRLDDLYAKLAAAPDQETATPIAEAIERFWLHSSSATAELLVMRAVSVAEGNRDLAMKLLDAAVELQPDYAEAWNRRAYVYYLNDDYKRALGDIRRVLALEPRHFKALEGLGQLLRTLGEKKGALKAYESLLAIYPAMPGAKQARDELRVEVEGQGI